MTIFLENHAAFDAIANSYDISFTYTEIGRMQRERVYFYLSKILAGLSGNKVLELGCGTGEDAIWLAKKKFTVKATDISEKMILAAKIKADHAGLHSEVTFQSMSMTDISTLPKDEKFDLIFSNFGGFNCLSPRQIQDISSPLTDHLRPGGQFVAVVMNRFCLWESLYFLTKISIRKAFRRMNPEGIDAPISKNTFVKTWYFSPSQFCKLLAPCFQQVAHHPIGFFIPPSYLSGFSSRWLRNLTRLEKIVQFIPFASRASDHFIIHLKRTA